MPRRATQRQPEPEPATLPEVLISPSNAAPNEKDAYWIALVDNPADFRKAIATEDFWPLLRKMPASLWSDNRLSLYLYRLQDDDGMMIKNPTGAKKYQKVLHQAIDEEFVSQRWGGGKYTLYLKLDSEHTLKECTFSIDGAPKLQTGQTVEIQGKPVAVGTAAPAAAPPPAESDTAKVIDALSGAYESATAVQKHASLTAIDMVKEQLLKPDANSSLLDKLLPILIERALQLPPPPPDPLAQLKLAKEILTPAQAPEPAEPKDPPITEAMSLVESFTGKPFSELIAGKKNPAAQPDNYGWVQPVMGAVQQFVAQLPQILLEARISRAQEFERQVWARNAKPGEAPPAHLLSAPRLPQAPPQQPPAQPAAPANQSAPANQPIDPARLVQEIVLRICQWFDARHAMGYQCAAMIDGIYGDHIESLGLDAVLGKEAEVLMLLQGNPDLARRAQDARWAQFQSDFLIYLDERWGFDDEEAPEPPPKTPTPMPAPKNTDTRPMGA